MLLSWKWGNMSFIIQIRGIGMSTQIVKQKRNHRNYYTFSIGNQWTDNFEACPLQAIRECGQTDCLNYSLIAQVTITVIFAKLAKVIHAPNARLAENYFKEIGW